MNTNKNIWVLRPKETPLWEAHSEKYIEFVERIWLAEWIMDKWKKGDVIIVEHVDANRTETKSM